MLNTEHDKSITGEHTHKIRQIKVNLLVEGSQIAHIVFMMDT